MTAIHVLSHEGLENIKAFTYKSGTSTFFDGLLNPWWEWVVTRVPTTMAPNTITLIGLLVGALPLFFYIAQGGSSWLGEDVTTRFYFNIACACAIFFYQTADAIDGKQARRTQSSSALGALFDHGCDAAITPILTYQAAVALGIPPTESILGTLFSISACSLFFVAQWEESIVHTLSTNVGGLGVTEAQLLLMILHVVAALPLGPSLTTPLFSIPFPSLPLKVSLGALAAVFSIVSTTVSLVSMLLRTLPKVPGAGALTSLVYHIGLCASFGVASWVRQDSYIAHAPWLLLLFCVSQLLVTTQTIVFSMARQQFSYFLWTPTAVILLFIAGTAIPDLMDAVIVYLAVGIVGAAYTRFVAGAMLQIAVKLNIHPFLIKKSE